MLFLLRLLPRIGWQFRLGHLHNAPRQVGGALQGSVPVQHFDRLLERLWRVGSVADVDCGWFTSSRRDSQCRDGSYSFSNTRRGRWSWQGSVVWWARLALLPSTQRQEYDHEYEEY